ncbi:hypothetical protein CP8484711_0901B, partial [Chlamydia psittaci 84-8471/1]
VSLSSLWTILSPVIFARSSVEVCEGLL